MQSRQIIEPQYGARLTGKLGRWNLGIIAVDDRAPGLVPGVDDPHYGGHAAIGVVRLHGDLTQQTGEYAILLKSDLKGRGVGWALMQLIIEYAKSQGLGRIEGQILQENSVMLKMCRELGFEIKTDAENPGVYDVTLTL